MAYWLEHSACTGAVSGWFDSLSTHHCWALSKSFIPSSVVWSMTKNNAFGGEKQNKKSNSEQSDLCDLQQVTLKPHLQVHHCWTTWLQMWCHSVLWGDSIQKGADSESRTAYSASTPRNWGNKNKEFEPGHDFLPEALPKPVSEILTGPEIFEHF